MAKSRHGPCEFESANSTLKGSQSLDGPLDVQNIAKAVKNCRIKLAFGRLFGRVQLCGYYACTWMQSQTMLNVPKGRPFPKDTRNTLYWLLYFIRHKN
jgi:hypothetical protein